MNFRINTMMLIRTTKEDRHGMILEEVEHHLEIHRTLMLQMDTNIECQLEEDRHFKIVIVSIMKRTEIMKTYLWKIEMNTDSRTEQYTKVSGEEV